MPNNFIEEEEDDFDAEYENREFALSAFKPGLMVFARAEEVAAPSPGTHIGTVDHLDGEDFIKLSKNDSPTGQHRWIPLDWVADVDAEAVYLNKSEPEVFLEILENDPGYAEAM